ncbi:preprotein translocase subunit SecE [Candidatus Dependentiae bacterium]|nr:MAG: preprotein translocase subunit SecE [Candidatus Dependentiae bacterium]
MNTILSFFSEVQIEFGKIIWPKRNEFLGSTIVVCILILFFAVILGGMDAFFGAVLKKLF